LFAVLSGILATTALGACSFIETDDLMGGEPHAKDASRVDSTTSDGPAIANDATPSSDATAADALVDAVADGANVGDAVDGSDADAGLLTYAQMILAESPLAYWRLGDTGLIARSEVGSNLSGAYSGAVTVGVPGAIVGDPDTAAHFGGSGGSIAMPDILAFDGRSPFTFELWARLPAADNVYRRLFGREGPGPGYNYSLLYQMSAPDLNFGISTPGANAIVIGSHAVPVNVWTHVVITRDGTTVSLYTNGVLSNLALSSTKVNDGGAATFRLGSDTYGSSELNGDLDEVAVYGKALDGGTIAAHYAAAGSHDAGADAATDH
jgi:hypothetical protein